MTLVRAGILAALVTAAVCLQVAAFPHVSFDGVVPNLALLVVVAAALVRGPDFAATLGFFAGLAIDLAPPADHVAGRWALALVVVGYVAGRVRQDAGTSAVAAVVTWGSEGGAPYVTGVPVGRVSTVYSSIRETSQRAVIEPFVDFAALDLVGVVVPSGTVTDGPVIEADGTMR